MDGRNNNYEVFIDCVSATVLAKSATKPTKQPKKRVARDARDPATSPRRLKEDALSPASAKDDDPAGLAEFIEYLATEIFKSLPIELQHLSYHSLQNDASLSDTYTEPLSALTLEDLTETIPPTVVDTLTAYSLTTPPATDLQSFMSPIFSSYVSAVTTAPPPWISTRKSACEICERDWVPLTYHHLIPRGVHAKVLKRGWHQEHVLNSVAWLCRACHSFVHRMASNEELARNWHTIERICERDDVQKWAHANTQFVSRSTEVFIILAENSAVDRMPVQKADICGGTEGRKRRSRVVDFESDYDQVQERWHRDPFGRDNNQSVTKAVANQKNLEKALFNEGFSQVRAAKIAFYMTRCEGQFQEWDNIVKKQPRLGKRASQEAIILDLTTKAVECQLGRALDDNVEEDEIEDGDFDGDEDEETSVAGGGRQRLRELPTRVTGGVSLAKGIRKSRSKRDGRQRRRDRKANALRIKEYADYTPYDYVQAARRYDIVYGSAENLYQLAKDHRASRLTQAEGVKNQQTVEMMIDGYLVDVEDPTFGLTQPAAEEALTREERKVRDLKNKQLWAEKQRDALIRSLERQDILNSISMSR